MKTCKKEALVQTAKDVMLWIVGSAVFLIAVIAFSLGCAIAVSVIANAFPLFALIVYWICIIAVVGILVGILIVISYESIKHRYDEHKNHCEWVQEQLKLG